MKKTNKIIITTIVMSIVIWSCSKVEVGYLSDYIKYESPILYVDSGSDFTSVKLLPDGSTKPLTVELLEIRNKETGTIAEDLLTLRPLVQWTEAYSYETDTTLAQVQAKLKTIDVPAFEFNTINGEIRWNPNTREAEASEYEFDLKISNVRGEKTYPGIGQVVMQPFVPVTYVTGSRIQVRRVTPAATLYSYVEDLDALYDGTSAINTVTKISNESAPGVTVILKVVDKNGTPFNPKTGEVLPNWPGFNLPFYEETSVDTELTDEEFIFHFPVTPFPFYSWYNANNPFRYYHIPNGSIGEIDVDEYNPDDEYWLNFRTNLQINGPGTWEIKIMYPNVTHK
ncbi:DUF5007 domain-containing protein [Cellulophaga sp. F20128]|uniref:DUF5007 domain-containing protein n=1 Tax=Cellulophaga sp. F20128 TaxID=2926413 RepID=UPI001FF29880|nr:DUF5007 domain-containing protein [Cellulophaga sp. F20128]MCK0158379.1 DUF5007 domain-containing protein [Cellulophaga sp. F20128]